MLHRHENESGSEGHSPFVGNDPSTSANASRPPLQDVGHSSTADERHPFSADALQALCDRIQAHYRLMKRAQTVRVGLNNAMGAFLRGELGWRFGLPKAEGAAISASAETLIAHGRAVLAYEARVATAAAKGKTTSAKAPVCDDTLWSEVFDVILANLRAVEPFENREKRHLKAAQECAMSLPVYPWVAATRGITASTLVSIVGEAGNLANYPTKGHLWKRMGLAVMSDGTRQRRTSKDWEEHRFSPARRAAMFVIGDPLVKRGERYRAIYLARKETERVKDPEASKMAVHRRAQRYMEKRLLRDLRREWIAVMKAA